MEVNTKFAAVMFVSGEEADTALQYFLLVTVGTIFIFVRFAAFWPFALVRLVVGALRERHKTVDAEERTRFRATFVRSVLHSESAAHVSLCAGCRFAQVLRGFEPDEQTVVCNYAYPRDVLMVVRECSDYKPKRERIGLGIAIEGAVSHPRLE